ncbi:MAG: acetate--CoA ligase [Sphingobacteriales bacterium]|nr:acetate--CoA ligase [Sphingobacteriales bacterium]
MLHKITSLEQYHEVYTKSVEKPEQFWNEIADSFQWHQKWEKVLNWNFKEPKVEWFINGKLNITENCLDRHLEKNADKPAIIWEANDPNEAGRTLTYKELHAEVCRFSNVLQNNGIQKGDRVCLYMPMVPELAVAVLACARVGAIHSVVFAGFSAQSLSDRINDSACKLLVTADGLYRGNKSVGLKVICDEALISTPSIQKVIVYKRTGETIQMQLGRDVWWHSEMQKAAPDFSAEVMDSEDHLFILYTSGSTGKPKGVVHSCAGYMVYTYYTFLNVFQYEEDDIFWCTADIGWITGHSYIVYGPLLNGATTVMFEGIPTYPDAGRFWATIDKLQITKFYTAPTAIRSLMASGLDFVKPYKLDTLKVIGSVGEPINEEAWFWYHDNIGKERCPIVDTWWQTETGGIMISPIAYVTPTKPTFATLPLPGVQPILVDSGGYELKENNVDGFLCMKFPWPGMIRTTFGDHERCRLAYFSTYDDLYFTGDGCRRDEDGYYRIIGRVDDVMNVSGHRLGTAEVENAINEHPNVIESAVVGYPHDIKGQGIYAFVIVDKQSIEAGIIDTDPAQPDGVEYDNSLHVLNQLAFENEVRKIVSKIISPIAKPDKIQIVSGLPKTRSGKIMRRILRKIAEGDTTNLGDITTLLDPSVVDEIINGARK